MHTDESTANEYYYYVDPAATYQKLRPSPISNLIDVYNLTKISESVARTNEDGTKGLKLRKSYKAYLNDLPGKYSTIPKEHTLTPVLFQNGLEPYHSDTPLQPLDKTLLESSLGFQKTPDYGIKGFDVSDLALGDSSSSLKRSKQRRANDEDAKRRRVDL